MQSLTKDQVLSIIADYNNDPRQVIAVLLDIQSASGKNYVEKQWAESVSEALKIPLSNVFEILTFYSMLSIEPRGEYIIEICKSTPCYFCGGKDIPEWFEAAAGINIGGTTPDGKISLCFTSCMGACDNSPAVKIGDDVFGNLTEEKVKALVKCCREDNIRELQSLCQN